MTSFISTLSLILLVLANGYFTFPINDGLLQNATISSSIIDVTSESSHIPRALFINEATTQLLNIDGQETTDALKEMQMTTLADDLTENASRQSRIWNEMTTIEPSMLTTDKPKSEKSGTINWETTTIDLNDDETTMKVHTQPKSEKRGTMDWETTTIDLDDDETTMKVHTQPKSEKRGTMDWETTTIDLDNDETTMKVHTQPKSEKSGTINWETTTIDLDDDETTMKVHTQPKSEKRGTMDWETTTIDLDDDETTMKGRTQPISDKREITPEVTTNTLPLEPTSSAVVLELSTAESTTKKYIGLLKDKKEQEPEADKLDEDKKPWKSGKTIEKNEELEKDVEGKKPWKSEKDVDDKKPWKSEKPNKTDQEPESEDDDRKPWKSDNTNKKETKDLKEVPTAQLYSDGLKGVSNYPQEYMELDENTVLTVTQSGSTDLMTTMENIKGKKPLNQGKESTSAKEEESNN